VLSAWSTDVPAWLMRSQHFGPRDGLAVEHQVNWLLRNSYYMKKQGFGALGFVKMKGLLQ
jgi:hypothetical protein